VDNDPAEQDAPEQVQRRRALWGLQCKSLKQQRQRRCTRAAANEQQDRANRRDRRSQWRAINQSTVGLTGLANAMVSGACIAMLRVAAIRKPLASQNRIARSSHAPPVSPSACIDDIAERTTAIPAR
jgi:hypothetical protein